MGGAGQAYSSGRNSQLGSRPVSISPHGFQRVYQYGPAFGRRNSIFFFHLEKKENFSYFLYSTIFFTVTNIRAQLCRGPELFDDKQLSPRQRNSLRRPPTSITDAPCKHLELAIITTLPVLVRQVIAKTPTAVAKVFINE